jgi:outer membrane protein assembly factor BamB
MWTNYADGSVWTFVTNGNGMSALKVAVDGSGNPSLTTQWQNAIATASPIVANNLVFTTGANVRAFDAITGTQLWSTPRAGVSHFHSPVVANGELYVTDATRLSAFALAGAGANVDAAARDSIERQRDARAG